MGKGRVVLDIHRLAGATRGVHVVGSITLARDRKMPVWPQQDAAQPGPSLELVLDAVGLAIGCLFCIISAVPLMKNFCYSGQELDALSVFRWYPCKGSAVARAAFLARYSPWILKNLLSLKGQQDVWLAAFLSFWLLRVASRICLPPRLYTHLAAPFLTFAARAAPLVLLLAAGRKSPISSAASLFVFRSHGFFDAIVSVTQPTSYSSAEIVFNIFSVVAVGLLAAWHGGNHGSRDLGDSDGGGGGDQGGGGGSAAATAPPAFVVQLLLQRAALMVAVHLLAGRILRNRRRRASSAGGGGRRHSAEGGLSSDEQSARLPPVPAMLAESHSQPQPQLELQQQQQQQQSRAFGTGAGRNGCAYEAETTTTGRSGYARDAETSSLQCRYGSCETDSCAAPDVAGEAAAAGEAEPAAMPALATRAAATEFEADAGKVANQTNGATSAAVPGYTAFRAGPAVPYRSPIRRRTVRIKIPFAEPEQIAPGYTDRLQALAAAKGLALSGVYVRQGCIELLLDVEALAVVAPKDGKEGPDTLPGGPGREAAFAAAAASGGAFSDVPDGDSWAAALSTDVEALLCALGLAALPPVELDEQVKSVVDVASARLGRATQPAPSPPAQRKQQQLPYTVQVSPRVLLLGPPSPPPLGGPTKPSGSAAARASPLFSVVVSYPGGYLCGSPAANGATTGDAVEGAESANTSATVTATAPPLPEVLIRSQGVFLPASVTARAGGVSSSGSGTAVSYEVELLELPARQGTALVELRWEGVLSPAVPLLVLHDEAVASEIQTAFAKLGQPCDGVAAARAADGAGSDFGGGAAGGASSALLYDDSLDDLLLDLGTWAAYSAAAAAHVADGASCTSSAAAALHLPYHTAEELALHLVRHAEACGWTATAGQIRAELEAARRGARASAGDASVAGRGAPAARDVGAAGGDRASLHFPPPPAPARPLLLLAFLQALGWSALPPKEESAYQAYAAPRVLSYSHIMQAVEVMSLLALLFRARQQLLDPGNLTSLTGCAVGTLTAAAWPLLPRRRWEALVNAAKIPRYMFYMTAKLMIGCLGFPAPPGIVPYQLGFAMLIMEGVLLPFSCLFSPRMALLLALLKFPFGVAMMLRSGATSDPVRAAVYCFRVVLAAVATTLACHTYLRFSYAAWAAPTAVAKLAGVAGGGKGLAKQSSRAAAAGSGTSGAVGGGGGGAAAAGGALQKRKKDD